MKMVNFKNITLLTDNKDIFNGTKPNTSEMAK